MLQVVPKWKVTITFPDHDTVFWINEIHIANVLRQIANLQFSENGLEQPTRITIG